MLRNVRTFNWVDASIDRNAEWDGWRMEGMDHFDPGESYTIVHDALEHFTKNETTLEQECMALGAMVHIRIMGGWWHRENPYNAGREFDILADDIIRFLAERQFKIKERRGCQVHEDIEVKDRDYVQHFVLGEGYHEWEGYPGRAAMYRAYIQCMRWVSLGYRKAMRRFPHAPHYVCDMFIAIQRKVEACKYAEHGDRLTIAFNCKTLEFRVTHDKYYELEGNEW